MTDGATGSGVGDRIARMVNRIWLISPKSEVFPEILWELCKRYFVVLGFFLGYWLRKW